MARKLLIGKSLPPISRFNSCLSFMKSFRVLVADHHPLFAEGIRTVLSVPANQMLFTVTAIARTTEQVEGYLAEAPTDLLLLDPSLPNHERKDWLLGIKKRFGGLRVLLFSEQNDPVVISEVMGEGADGYLLKTASKDELRRAISEISEGRQYLGRGVSSSDTGVKAGKNAVADYEYRFAQRFGLTKREVEIVRYIGQAMSNKEIADKLYISDQTVSVHRKNIMRKLKVNSTASLVKMVYDNQLIIGAR